MSLSTEYGHARAEGRSCRPVLIVKRSNFVILSVTIFCLSIAVAAAEPIKTMFAIEAQPAKLSLTEYAQQADVQVGYTLDIVENVLTNPVIGEYDIDQALELLLKDTGLKVEHGERGLFIRRIQKRVAGGGVEEPAPALATTNSVQLSQTLAQGAAQGQAMPGVGNNGAENDSQPMPIEEIVVTGSNIRGIENSSSPVLVFDRQAIENAGVGTLRQFFETIPQVFGGGANTGNQIRATGTGGVSTLGLGSEVNIRGLGTGTTLTLINGHRVTTSETGGIVDITAIPQSAVERIEILTDGASAIYGSDAIGGVVNVILRTDFDGFETRLRYGTATQGSMDEVGVSLAAGSAWDRGHSVLTVDYFEQNNLPASERSFSQAADFLPIDLIPASERISLFGAASQELGANVTVSGEAFYSDRDTDFIITSSVGISNIDGTSETFGATVTTTIGLPADWLASGTVGISENEASSTDLRNNAGILTTIVEANETSTWLADANFEGRIFDSRGGEVRLAIGGSVRQTEFDGDPRFTDGVASSSGGVSLERDVAAVFAELYLPMVGESNRFRGVERFDVTAAVRYDDYSDFGGTTNPKFGALWEIVPGLIVRGTYGTSFRAPILTDLDTSRSVVVGGSLPGDVGDGTQGVGLLSLWAAGGNPSLEAEEATTYSFGVEWLSSDTYGPSARANYYDIDYTNRIAGPGAPFPVSANANGIFASVLTFDPTPAEIDTFVEIAPDNLVLIGGGPLALPPGFVVGDAQRLLDLRINNISEVEQRGVDFSFDYRFPVEDGDVSVGLAGDYILDINERLTPQAPKNDVLDTLFHPVGLKVRAHASYSNGPLRMFLFINHIDEYIDNSTDPVGAVSSWTTTDLTISYELESIADGLNLSLSARNLFDEDPPFIGTGPGRGTGFDPTNANPLGRFVSFDVRANW